jgi:hypothetical protein
MWLCGSLIHRSLFPSILYCTLKYIRHMACFYSISLTAPLVPYLHRNRSRFGLLRLVGMYVGRYVHDCVHRKGEFNGRLHERVIYGTGTGLGTWIIVRQLHMFYIYILASQWWWKLFYVKQNVSSVFVVPFQLASLAEVPTEEPLDKFSKSPKSWKKCFP